MEWNHRIVFDSGIWEIREVYYKGKLPVGHCAADLWGETPAVLLEQYNQIQEAFQLPILSVTEEDTLVEGASPLQLAQPSPESPRKRRRPSAQRIRGLHTSFDGFKKGETD